MSPKPPDHTLDAIRALLATPPERLELYKLDTGALLDTMRHLVDVVDRQHDMLERCEWADHDIGDIDGAQCCPRCKNHKSASHRHDCALDALLRETA